MDTFRALLVALNKPGVLVRIQPSEQEPAELFDEILKAAPLLKTKTEIISAEWGLIVCDSEAEMDAVFDTFAGDDGPTKSNPYNGPAKVYAEQINAKGESLYENT